MEGIPDDIDCPSIDHPDQNATAAHALSTDRRNPSFNPGGVGLLGNGELRPLPKSTPKGNGNACASTHLQKISAIELHNFLLDWNDGVVEYWNNGSKKIRNRFILPFFPQHSIIPTFHYSSFISNMTCQTIIGYFFLPMTIHTPPHGHLNPGLRGWSFALSDIPMTVLTIHLS
jgi:hypothetical protein